MEFDYSKQITEIFVSLFLLFWVMLIFIINKCKNVAAKHTNQLPRPLYNNINKQKLFLK